MTGITGGGPADVPMAILMIVGGVAWFTVSTVRTFVAARRRAKES